MDIVCKQCGKRLKKWQANCLACGQVDEELARQYFQEKLESRARKRERQEKEFAEKFDEKAIEIISNYLHTKADHLTMKELLEVLQAENMMQDFKFADAYKRPNAYQSWSTRRVVGLAKWLHHSGHAFLGTTTRQGHPYLLYLPSKVPEGVAPYNPEDIHSKANWSVGKLTKAKKALFEKRERFWMGGQGTNEHS